MDRLPLLRVAEVAFLAGNVQECIDFYRKIGLAELPTRARRLNFANVGEQLFGVCDEKTGFFDPWTGGFSKSWRLHVAFEVPFDKMDECIAFLNARGIKTSPKIPCAPGFHSVPHAISIYFTDPAGNIIELWAPSRSPE